MCMDLGDHAALAAAGHEQGGHTFKVQYGDCTTEVLDLVSKEKNGCPCTELCTLQQDCSRAAPATRHRRKWVLAKHDSCWRWTQRHQRSNQRNVSSSPQRECQQGHQKQQQRQRYSSQLHSQTRAQLHFEHNYTLVGNFMNSFLRPLCWLNATPMS